ncbi:MAG TPA: hypothetical protein VGU45_10830 [Microvirga sp.]|jgi:DNA-binding transcriptional MocR family regulator|nr:hypothetical protein [Microvirga sp.]
MERHLIEIERRNEVFRSAARELAISLPLRAPYVWLHLPQPWRLNQFSRWCSDHSLAAMPGSMFNVDRVKTPQAVRLTLSGASTLEQVRTAAELISEALSAPPPMASDELLA